MVRHATKVNSGTHLALIGNLFDMDGAELIFHAFWLALRQLSTWFDHVNANQILCLTYDVLDAYVVVCLTSCRVHE